MYFTSNGRQLSSFGNALPSRVTSLWETEAQVRPQVERAHVCEGAGEVDGDAAQQRFTHVTETACYPHLETSTWCM